MATELVDDRILPLARIVAAIVVPFLVLAFVILYFYPESTGQRFAWPIQPQIMAMFMGAGYIGGAWLFANCIFGQRWHRVAPGYLPVTTFTIFMLLSTIVHWERFDIRHFPFVLWLALYIATPFLVPFVWFKNRSVDHGAPEAIDFAVPDPARRALFMLGAVLLAFAVAGFAVPGWPIAIWPWALTPLTARVISGWLSLLGVGGMTISRETRWSAWKVGLQSIGLWHLLVLIATFIRKADLAHGFANWYVGSVVTVLAAMLVLYVMMETRLHFQSGAAG